MKTIKTGSDFSGVGAFDYAIERVAKRKGFIHERIFACDWDKYARITYSHNHGEPKYYPKDVYEREIPKESLDIYMTSPPCQAFSVAGNRKGESDKRGVLFYNSHEFIQKNKPRYFIFENVKGLLSDDNGKTFQRWIDYLGGKSVNGTQTMFPIDESVPYHVYHKVINTKDHGVPQNRERIFIVGVRDDLDNNFRFPKEEFLYKRLRDVLENDVDEKYFLSEKMLELLTFEKKGSVEIANINKGGQKGSVASEDGKYIGCLSATDYKLPKLIHVKSATKKGYESATENDSINLEFPDSKTRRGRVGKGVSQTLDTGCNQGVCIPVITPDRINKRQNGRRFKDNGDPSFTVTTQDRHGIFDGFKIRRLTPRECFRLQDFPESFDFSVVSNSQAYKQAGNSITVRVLEKIIENLKL